MTAEDGRNRLRRRKPHRWPRATLKQWLAAWLEVMRNPDKKMPEPPDVAPDEPIPEDLELYCPDCGYPLGGLTGRICPGCGQRFSVQRAWTVRMLREPEFFLRYRFAPQDINRITISLVLLLASLLLLSTAITRLTTGPLGQYSPTGIIAVVVGLYGLAWILVLLLPSLILIKFLFEIPWHRTLFHFSVVMFLVSLLYFAASLVDVEEVVRRFSPS